LQKIENSDRIPFVVVKEKDQLRLIKEVLIMAKCAICSKAAHFGNNVSHSHRRSNRIWKANVKSVKVNVNGNAQKMYVCTKCLRSGFLERA
jgi:large subunit ribosomal protein L28